VNARRAPNQRNGLFSVRSPILSDFVNQRERHYEVLEVEDLAVASLALD
jgi:hypothetical protein